MGADLVQNFHQARAVFEEADEVLGFPLSRMCFEGPEEELRQTEFTQPAIVATSLAAWRVLEARDIRPVMAAGHSVGEYAALAAAGVLSIRECLKLVRKRGLYMQEAGDIRPGGMAAVIGLTVAQCEEVGRRVREVGAGVLEVANINAPDQVVVSGERGAVEAGAAIAKELGARRYLPLPVSAAFHSSLMIDASSKLSDELDTVEFKQAQFPVVANVMAAPVVHPDEVREALRAQIASRVRWVESVQAMLARGVTTFVEVGPGTALSGMIRRISSDAKVVNVQDSASLRRTLDTLQSGVAG